MTPHDKEAAELLPCPFCGGTDIRHGQDDLTNYIVGCEDCGAQIGNNDSKGIERWNRRAALCAPAEAGDYGFRPMLSAPQDGTEIEILIYHSTRHMYAEKDRENWEQIVIGKWIDFNGGGWTWQGMAGSPVGWRAIEARKEQG